MTNKYIVRILREAALALRHEFDYSSLQFVETNVRHYELTDLAEFKRDLTEAARQVDLLVLEHRVEKSKLNAFVKESNEAILLLRQEQDLVVPVLIAPHKAAAYQIWDSGSLASTVDTTHEPWLSDEEGFVTCLAIMVYKSILSEGEVTRHGKTLTPVRRLFRLLATERKEIIYVLLYALIIGLVSLVLPLGLQTTIELISGGVFFSSVYILIGLVILGVLVTGGLQIVQISLVEHLQRRIFTKAALEFAFRIPRIRLESLLKNYAPELVNRFFDVMTIQKGLPKLLIDLSAGGIQIFFGLLLLSLYHPFFVFFSFFLVITLGSILYFTGQRGLQSSLKESKYKYKVVQWLEELARTINSFKLAGNSDLPIRKTDYALGNYLKNRKTHFKVLITQFSLFVFFKMAVTAGLLIMGTILVIDREITLGQFVAAEVIIILVLNAVEKIVMYMDVVYDLLTAVEKVGHVTDLPIERSGGFDFPPLVGAHGYHIEMHNMNYQYPGRSEKALENISLNVKPGERICIVGAGGSGKTTLTNILAGLFLDYEGDVSINQISMRDLDLSHLRDKVAKNISQEDIFDGTLLENITVGKQISIDKVVNVLERVGLRTTVSSWPDGLSTQVLSGGKGLTSSMVHRIILARCLVKDPKMIILNDFFSGLSKSEKLQMVQSAMHENSHWTFVAVSNDPMIMAVCDRIIVLDQGKLIADNTYEELLRQGTINKYFE